MSDLLNRTILTAKTAEVEAVSSSFSGDRALARRKGLYSAEASIAYHTGSRKKPEAERKVLYPATLPNGEWRGFGGKAPECSSKSTPLVITQAEFPDTNVARPQSLVATAFNAAGEKKRDDEEKRLSIRSRRYNLQFAASKIARGLFKSEHKKLRVAFCGKKATSPVVDFVKSAGVAHAVGVETCGSIWACPVCAAKIIQKRREEVRTAIGESSKAGGAVYMMAFTAAHSRKEPLKQVKNRISNSWQKLLAGRFKAIKEDYGIIGYVRALEVTHGETNGWHPHIHILFFLDKPLPENIRENLEWDLFNRWDKIICREGGQPCNQKLFNLELCANPDAAGDYVAKWGADSEITNLHAKNAKNGGKSPFQLLSLYQKGGKNYQYYGKLFGQFMWDFKGARHLTWSRGLKKLFKIVEIIDQKLADEMPAENILVGSLDRQNYYITAKIGLGLKIIEAAERGGQEEINRIFKVIRKTPLFKSHLLKIEKRKIDDDIKYREKMEATYE